MKNQYFGDINDYKKYALLRLLSNSGEMKIAVCWMLTADDQRSEGQRITYLSQPTKWRMYDAALFDRLLPCLTDPTKRNVSWAEIAEVVPGAKYYTELLIDNRFERERYFRELGEFVRTCDLTFFDPDNGLEVKSKPYGRRDSSKFLYWRELERVWADGQSILLYQHFRREERAEFTRAIAADIQQRLRTSDVITFSTAHVLFVLVPQMQHRAHCLQQSERVAQVWGSTIEVRHWEHPLEELPQSGI